MFSINLAETINLTPAVHRRKLAVQSRSSAVITCLYLHSTFILHILWVSRGSQRLSYVSHSMLQNSPCSHDWWHAVRTHSITPGTTQAETIGSMKRNYRNLQHVGRRLFILHKCFCGVESLCVKWHQHCKLLWWCSHCGDPNRRLQVRAGCANGR